MKLKCSITAGNPQGSYLRSCTNAVLTDGILSATCKDQFGFWNYTELQMPEKFHDIANCNGMLCMTCMS